MFLHCFRGGCVLLTVGIVFSFSIISNNALGAEPVEVEKGLFHGSISQSGGSFGPIRSGGGRGENVQSLADAERTGGVWALKAGASSVEALRRLPPDNLLTARLGQGIGAWLIMNGRIILSGVERVAQKLRLEERGQPTTSLPSLSLGAVASFSSIERAWEDRIADLRNSITIHAYPGIINSS